MKIKDLLGNWGSAAKDVGDAARNVGRFAEQFDAGKLSRELSETGREIRDAAQTLTRHLNRIGRNTTVLRNAGLAALGIGTASTVGYQISKMRNQARWQKFLENNPEVVMHAIAHRGAGGQARGTEKRASAKEKLSKVLRSRLMRGALPVVGGALATVAVDAVKRVHSRAEARDLWRKFLERYPEYRTNPKAEEYFSILVDYNPSAARHPSLIKSYLDHMVVIERDAGGLPNIAKQLAEVQRNYYQGRERPTVMHIDIPTPHEEEGRSRGEFLVHLNHLERGPKKKSVILPPGAGAP